jgi:Fe-S-cluster-containing hydrogenase component 2
MACPQGSITTRQDKSENLRIADKCDLCAGRENGPACVQACPNDALLFEDRDEKALDTRTLKGSMHAFIEGEDVTILE